MNATSPREKPWVRPGPSRSEARSGVAVCHHSAAVSKPGKAPRLGLATASTLKSRAMLAPIETAPSPARRRRAESMAALWRSSACRRNAAARSFMPRRASHSPCGRGHALRRQLPARRGRGRKNRHGGEIGFARIAQGIGEAMPLHRLQGFAARRGIVAIVDDEEHAALRRNAPGKPRHHTEPRQTPSST